MKIWKNALLFYTGGAGYLTLELLYRGRSHGSMFLAGGVCFLLIGHLNRVSPRLPLPARAAVGALIVTMVEWSMEIKERRCLSRLMVSALERPEMIRSQSSPASSSRRQVRE